jgi:hypothetical protein
MNADRLNRLLDKYYSGGSSSEEELELFKYFSGDNIPEGFEAEREIFGYYKEQGSIPEPSKNFEDRILFAIDTSIKKQNSIKYRNSLVAVLSAAAGLLLLFGSYFFFIHQAEPEDTFNDPKIAYTETMKILVNISAKMNHGTGTLEPVGKLSTATNNSFKTLNKSGLIIRKNLKSLSNLSKSIESERGKTKK